MEFSRDLYSFNSIKKYPSITLQQKPKSICKDKVKLINLAVDKLIEIYPEKKYLEELRKLPDNLGKKHKKVKLVFENTYLAKSYQMFVKI